MFGVCVAGVSFWATQAILGQRGAGVSFGEPGAGRVVLASALLAPVSALAGLALGAVLRHTATTMIATVGVLFLLPLLLTDGRRWTATAGHALPYRAWLRLVDVDYSATAFPWSTGGAWTVYAAWAAAGTAVATAAVHHRDQ